MNKPYWLEKWKSNEIGFNQATPNILLQKFIPNLNIKPNTQIFVPLCGKSVDMIWLAGSGFSVVGVEISEIACQDFFRENSLDYAIEKNPHFTVYQSENIKIFAGDFFKLTQNDIPKVDLIYDRAALIALPVELRASYCQQIASLCNIGAKILLITTCYDQNEMDGPPFSIDEDEVKTLYADEFIIDNIYKTKIKQIPPHLKAKGLKQAYELAFCLIKT